MARKERYLVGLDVGTAKITAIVGETTEDGGLDIIGMGLADSRTEHLANSKRRLLETYIEAEGPWWEDPTLRSLDLEYHNVDPAEGLYAALEESGAIHRFVDDDLIAEALTRAPDTRAALRGELVSRWGERIERISWGSVTLKTASGPWEVELPLESETVARLRTALAAAKTVEDAAAALAGASPGVK